MLIALCKMQKLQESTKEVKAMKRITTTLGIAVLFVALAIPVFAWGPGWGGGGRMMGYWGGGPGHCWDYDGGYGRRAGTTGPGYESRRPYQQAQEPLNETDAKAMVDEYVNSTRNPNLKVGEIKEKGSSFEAEILTKDGSLVDKIAIDKNTGWMRSAY
jgi:hypothetical protein